jgi:hypothetical protein
MARRSHEVVHMTERARRILEVFAESYPTSAHYQGGRKLRKAGWEEVFPHIVSDVEEKSDFLDAVDELVTAGILSVKWKRFREGDDLEALYLENPSALFSALKIPSPESVARAMIAVLDAPDWSIPPLADLAAHLRPRIAAGHPVAVRDVRELEDLARLFSLSPEEAAASPLRALSARLYGDTKRLERLLPVADRLARAIGSSAVSERLRLVRSYPEVALALWGKIAFEGGATTWECRGEILSLPLSTAERIRAIELAAPSEGAGTPPRGLAVLSIENKETFHVLTGQALRGGFQALPAGVAAIVYTAGHPNEAVKSFLRECVGAGAHLLHYGDMDPDGILILQEIQEAAGTAVTPWLMTAALHRQYGRFGYALDRTQMARLVLVREQASGDLCELAAEIAATGVGVEQEVIDLRDDPHGRAADP